MNKTYLSDKFLSKYSDYPANMSEYGKMVYLRTYSRYLNDEFRRETWKETVARAVNYNMSLEEKHQQEIKNAYNPEQLKIEAELLFDAVFNLKGSLSGRTLYVGGTEITEKTPMANFNCSFTCVEKTDDLSEVFYLLMLGSGVGVSVEKQYVDKLPTFRKDVKLTNLEYNPKSSNRLEDTEIYLNNTVCKIIVGDSRKGWVDAFKTYLNILTRDEFNDINEIIVDFDNIRKKGERVRGFGGTASGAEPLMFLFKSIIDIINGELDNEKPVEINGRVKLKSKDIIDISNLIAHNVVAGGIRRSAEICLVDADDIEGILHKYAINGLWGEQAFENHKKIINKMKELKLHIPEFMFELSKPNKVSDDGTVYNDTRMHLNHRRLSNNSIIFKEKPTKEFLDLLFLMIKTNGEPGFINLEEGRRRNANMKGINPCAEILLDTKEQCNLVTMNIKEFVKFDDKQNKNVLDYEELFLTEYLLTRASLRMTLIDLELKEWDEKLKRDRLCGVSMTGYQDAIGMLKWDKTREKFILTELKNLAIRTASEYAKDLRIPEPLLTTTVKPEGTLSQVFNGVSSGVHYSHSNYFMRRIRFNSSDPLALALKESGFKIYPEVGYDDLNTAPTWVVEFPLKSEAIKTKDDATALDQLENYFMFQEDYTQHNTSITITVKPNEWDDVADKVYENWDRFVGVSFLEHFGGDYPLLPYQAITEEEYEKSVKELPELDLTILQKYDIGMDLELEELDCKGGGCSVR